MNRKTVKRLLVSIGIVVGVVVANAGPASAGLYLNHAEPTLTRR